MRTKIKLILLMLMPVLMLGMACVASPIMAADDSGGSSGTVETNLFGTVTDNGDGCGVYTILNLILTVLTFGVGIAATVGLVIAAIIYLTAGDDTGKTAKAKSRIFDIVIGLLIYAMMWAALNWLIPGGVLNTGKPC